MLDILEIRHVAPAPDFPLCLARADPSPRFVPEWRYQPEFRACGDVSAWLTSETFGLPRPDPVRPS